MELARSRSATIISTSSANCLHHSYLMKLLLSALMVISCIIAGPNLCSVPCNAQSPLSSGDLQALLRFKAKLQDPLSKLSTWSGSNGDPCTTWYGVNCTNAPENSSSSSSSSSSLGVNANVVVSELRLRGLGLGGGSAEEPLLSIVASLLGSLDTIRVLDLSDNAFQGGIGAGFGPVGCGRSSIIQEINLSFNNLSGILPQDMSFQCGTLSKLDLSHNHLTGALPTGTNGGSSSSSGFLTDLNLSYNLLSGEIPEESGLFFGSSPNLKSLDLSANHLSGTLPDSIFAQHCGNGLEYLDLSSNELSGPIPPSLLQKCTSLQYLNLSNNNIGGRFDTAPFGLGSLKTLDISNNSLAGPIPSGLGDSACSNLAALNLSMNNLSGSIPQSFASCASLAFVDLSYNNMSGELPADTLSEMRALEILVLSFNQFSGALPTSILTSHTLKVLDMGSNKLSGALPSLPPTSNLEEFLVPNNGFSGEIPVAFGNASRLKVLDLSFNHLQGPIPHELGLLSQLEKLSIWYNNLSGEIPYTIGYLSKLRILILNNNALSGAIPSGIANCTSLEWISLSSNNLTGCIPASIGTMRSLTLLDLGNNGLYGVIPPEIANASMFVWVDLHNNRLTGPIPPGLGSHPGRAPASRVTGVVFAFIRNNLLNGCRGMGTLLEFEGITEEALAPTPLMTSCNSSRLYLGDVLNKDPDLTSVQYLDLSYNSLDGTIPDEMGDLTALVMLSLAHNELVGTIPASFIHLAGLGVLDLSYNKLQGSMSPLANCSFLVSIDVSNNNFSGSIPSTGQLSTTPAQGFLGNPLLCGEPLPACGSNNLQSRNCTPDGSNNCGSARHNHMAVLPWANSIVLGILSAVAFICMIIVWGIMMRAKGKHKDTDNMLTNLQLGSCHGNSSGWNLGGEKEPLSINVATFERPLRKLTFAQLIEATNGFSQESLIGIGGFGEVYKAELKDGSIVAIKKLLQFSYQGDREFTAEMETLGKIKHRNLVPLLGYCKVGEERLLVYEYMHGGSLDDMLHGDDATNGEGKKQKLTWDLRKRIARGAARGLSFLHHNCIPHIIHRDMKSSNVLLDQSMEARVSDFGMARLISALDTHLSVSTLAGTPGYVPPEYYQSFRCTTKGDIYSFGVILLELLTGKRPTDKEFFEDTNLVGWVRQLVNENKSLETLDPSLRDGCHASDELEMLQYLRIACDCVQDQPSKRPSMLEIVSMLKELQVQEGLSH